MVQLWLSDDNDFKIPLHDCQPIQTTPACRPFLTLSLGLILAALPPFLFLQTQSSGLEWVITSTLCQSANMACSAELFLIWIFFSFTEFLERSFYILLTRFSLQVCLHSPRLGVAGGAARLHTALRHQGSLAGKEIPAALRWKYWKHQNIGSLSSLEFEEPTWEGCTLDSAYLPRPFSEGFPQGCDQWQ